VAGQGKAVPGGILLDLLGSLETLLVNEYMYCLISTLDAGVCHLLTNTPQKVFAALALKYRNFFLPCT
jgi:uncharacterized membrane protein YeiH